MPEDEGIALPFFFIGTEDVPIQLSNLQVIQHVQQEFIITFAQFAPPLVMGTREEQEEQVKAKPYLPVKTVARLSMSPERVLDLIKALQENYDNWKAGGG
ncbi:MAG TPA: hypothetical protein VFP63_07415 [Dehalococcoidia bacterium]|nr:hypothetical protein [Dehalococcoidia bacterium]